jgi:peroxiredoxin
MVIWKRKETAEMGQRIVRPGAHRGAATPWRSRPVVSVVGAVAVALLGALGWLVATTASPAKAAAPSDAERAELAAQGRELLIAADERPEAPPIRLQTAPYGDGSVFDLSTERGNVVVLFFMAAWCPTCVPEAQALAQLHETYADQGVRVLVLDVDQRETENEMEDFRARAGGGEHLWAMDVGNEVAKTYKVRSLDTTYVIDDEGRVAYGDGYPTGYERLAAVVEALL